jgi:hypothetical protein
VASRLEADTVDGRVDLGDAEQLLDRALDVVGFGQVDGLAA